MLKSNYVAYDHFFTHINTHTCVRQEGYSPTHYSVYIWDVGLQF